MKKISQLILFGLMILISQTARSQNYYLTHCDGEISSKANPLIEGAATVGVATIFTEEELASLKGSEIFTLRAGIVSKLKVTDFTIWVSATPEGPALGSARIESGELKSGWNEVELDQPVAITGEPLYVGYTFTQPSKSNVISIVSSERGDPVYLNDGNGWKDVSDEYQGALSVEAGVRGSTVGEYEISATRLRFEDDNVEAGGTAWLTIDFTNRGTKEISEIAYEIETPDGTHVFTQGFPEVESRGKGQLHAGIPVGSAAGDYPISFRVRAIEGKEAGDPAMQTTALTVVAPPYLKHNVLIEDFSNEFCVNCPAASERMDKVLEKPEYQGNTSLVVHHAGSSDDRFTIAASREYEWLFSNRKYSPMTTYNRLVIDGKRDYVPSSEAEIDNLIERALNQEVNFSLGIIPVIDLENGLIEVKATGYRASGGPQDDVTLTVFLTESGIETPIQQGALGFYIHNNMLRAVNATWGETIGFDNDGKFEKTVTLSFDGNEWKKENCRLIAFLSNDNEASPSYREILQSASLPLHYAESGVSSGIKDVVMGSEDFRIIAANGKIEVEGVYADYEIYDINGLPVRADKAERGLYIVTVRGIDGKQTTRKIIL